MEGNGVVAIDRAGEADTFPKLLIHNAATRGSRIAMRHKDLGIWQSWTWAQVLDEVRAFSVGLEELGLKRGDKIADHRLRTGRGSTGRCAPRRRSAPCRCRSMRTRSPTRWPMCSSTPRSTFAVVEDQEQVDKLLSIADRLTTLAHMVYDEPRGLRDYDHAQAHLDRRRAEARAREACRRSVAARRAGKPRSRRARAPTSRSSSTPRARPGGRRA